MPDEKPKTEHRPVYHFECSRCGWDQVGAKGIFDDLCPRCDFPLDTTPMTGPHLPGVA